MTEMLTAARLIWWILAQIPWLTRCLLRRFFPVNECKNRFLIEIRGESATFELLSVRPMHALANVRIVSFNALPCDVEFEATRLAATIDSCQFLDVALNISQLVPVATRVHMHLPEITLSCQQVDWLKNLARDYTRVQFSLYWRCKSVIHDWEADGTFEFPAHIRK